MDSSSAHVIVLLEELLAMVMPPASKVTTVGLRTSFQRFAVALCLREIPAGRPTLSTLRIATFAPMPSDTERPVVVCSHTGFTPHIIDLYRSMINRMAARIHS